MGINKEHPILFKAEMVNAILKGIKTQTRRVKPFPLHYDVLGERPLGSHPIYRAGDLLWVKETFAIVDKRILYKASFEGEASIKWKSSLFMPRSFSRINLEITDIRLERLWDITEEDALAEGVALVIMNTKILIEISSKFSPISYYKPLSMDNMYRAHYAAYWDVLNYKKYPWKNNPWVWVINFKRIK